MITVNKEKLEERVNRQGVAWLAKVQENAENGEDVTEIIVPNSIASAVRSFITNVLNTNGTKYSWLIVREGINPHTGGVDHFTSMTVGDSKLYKLKILS